jgi:hypothetical protein
MKRYFIGLIAGLMLLTIGGDYAKAETNYPNGFAGGVSISGVPIVNTYVGKIFWVGSTIPGIGTSDGNPCTRKQPCSTLDYTVSKTVANRGDVILVAPNHYELLMTPAAIDIDVAGISVVGLGSGTNRPMFDLSSSIATFAIGADDVTIDNLNFHANKTLVAVGVDIEDGVDNATIRNSLFDVETTTTDEFLISIQTNDATNNALIEGNYIDMGLGGAVAGISFTKDTDSTIVKDNIILGDFSTANINGITTLSTKLFISGNTMFNGDGSDIATEPCIEFEGNTTGIIQDNYCATNLSTKAASVVCATCLLFENYYNEDASGSGTGGIIGTPSADG